MYNLQNLIFNVIVGTWNDDETDGTLLHLKKNHNDCSTKRRLKNYDLHRVEEVMSQGMGMEFELLNFEHLNYPNEYQLK